MSAVAIGSAVVVLANLATFTAFGVDKARARRAAPRIPERSLLLLTLAMGAVGAWTGMRVFRHKTRKTSFRAWLALASLANVAWIWLGWRLGAFD
jgi:uncharacterized membrane protein YsdA (DUF1294 family)